MIIVDLVIKDQHIPTRIVKSKSSPLEAVFHALGKSLQICFLELSLDEGVSVSGGTMR